MEDFEKWIILTLFIDFLIVYYLIGDDLKLVDRFKNLITNLFVFPVKKREEKKEGK